MDDLYRQFVGLDIVESLYFVHELCWKI